ncbi:AMP-binding protein [Saccharomonospora sp. NPDC046836]|uniref:AMP-binding protein n=1 Tax=Saccharomonospora sp. NPDC046836 TaxID=3156921 RepID=UPI00341185B8
MAAIFGATESADWRPREAEAEKHSILDTLVCTSGETDLPGLHRRSVEDPEWFWREVLQHVDLAFTTPFESVLDPQTADTPFPRWFPGGRLNAARTLLDRPKLDPESVAFVAEDEDGSSKSLTRAELRRDVASAAASLREHGVRGGDRVALFLPMIAEAAVAYLACAAIGAVAVPVFSGYGPQGVAARMELAECVALVTADGFTRRDRWISLWDTACQAAAQCPKLRLVVRVASERDVPEMPEHTITVPWSHLVADEADLDYTDVESDHPMLVMFTSGTTGEPKGVVLTHAGFLTKVATEFGIVFAWDETDSVLWLGDIGWMVGPLLMTSALLLGATAILYGGALDRPDDGRLWDLVQKHRVTVLGVSPTAVRALQAAGDEWPRRADLASVRAVISTGEAWNEKPWWWLFDTVFERQVPLHNYTGGTETGGGILSTYADRPLRSCAFFGPVLGMDADVVDDNGNSVRGVPGELVVRRGWPGMTRGLWGSEGRERYLKTYWNRYEGMWAHGDLARIDDDGHWMILGRADDTLKVAGKRVGPSEVETALLSHPAAVSAAAIGVPDPDRGQVVVCFVVSSAPDADGLVSELRQRVIDRLGRSLAPAEIHLVPTLPVTKTGKIMRRLVRAAHLGEPTGDVAGLENPDSLDEIPRLAGADES